MQPIYEMHDELHFAHFAHRANANGTVDSICKECFATIHTAKKESDLKKAEREHICKPEDLERFNKLRPM
jgi:hypothetical protein